MFFFQLFFEIGVFLIPVSGIAEPIAGIGIHRHRAQPIFSLRQVQFMTQGLDLLLLPLKFVFPFIGGFLAIRDKTKGLVIGKREPTMGLRGIPETEILFQDMEIGDDMVVLPPSGFRRGFADLMNAYNSQRVGAATVALGLADGAYQHALDYANAREQ